MQVRQPREHEVVRLRVKSNLEKLERMMPKSMLAMKGLTFDFVKITNGYETRRNTPHNISQAEKHGLNDILWHWQEGWLTFVHESVEEADIALSKGEISPSEYLEAIKELSKR